MRDRRALIVRFGSAFALVMLLLGANMHPGSSAGFWSIFLRDAAKGTEEGAEATAATAAALGIESAALEASRTRVATADAGLHLTPERIELLALIGAAPQVREIVTHDSNGAMARAETDLKKQWHSADSEVNVSDVSCTQPEAKYRPGTPTNANDDDIKELKAMDNRVDASFNPVLLEGDGSVETSCAWKGHKLALELGNHPTYVVYRRTNDPNTLYLAQLQRGLAMQVHKVA